MQTLSQNLKSWDLSDIKKKMIIFHFDNKLIAILYNL